MKKKTLILPSRIRWQRLKKKANLLYLNNDADVFSSDCPMFLVKKYPRKSKKHR